jgi:tetratricopeptide (TPR) repeat protein
MWRDVLKKRPDNFRACIALSTTLVGEGRAEEVESLCRGLLGRLPDFARMSFQEIGEARGRDWSLPCVEYAMAHNNIGAALLLRERREEAKVHFIEAIRVLPRATWARRNLAQTLFTEGRMDDSATEWQVILRIDPRNIPAHGFLGLMAMARNQYGPAAEHYRAALSWAADDGYIRTQLAWILAACPDDRVRDGAEAVRVAKPLVQSDWAESARAYDVLAAAYAEVGDFDKALQLAGRAILLAREGRDAELPSPTGAALPQLGGGGDPRGSLENAIRDRLELYRQKKPFRAGGGPNAYGTAFSFSGYPSSRILPPHDGNPSLPK